MADPIEKVRADIAELGESLRQIRVEQGLPPESPEHFVPIPLSIVLVERVRPLIPIAAKYAALLADGTLYRIDTSKLDQYRKDAALLHMSTGIFCSIVGTGVGGLIRMMERVNEIIDAGEEDTAHIPDLLRHVHFALEWARYDIKYDMWDNHIDIPPREQEHANRNEIERLKNDPAAFQAEYDAAMTQYETIKHLI